jgi:hydrogenase expression/formation protein HypE
MDMPISTRLIRAVLFDFDGTLTEPGSLDFGAVRDAIGCPRERPVLEFINSIASQAKRDEAHKILDAFEAEAARQSRPNSGAEDALEFLRARGIKVGIISRNSMASIRTALDNFARIQLADFAVILSRNDPYNPKPSPEGILAAAGILEVPVAQVLVVGDFVFDVEAGRNAGALTAFLTNRGFAHPCTCPSDFTLEHLGELNQIVAPLEAGE